MKLYLALIVMTMLGSVASLFLKKAAGSGGPANLLRNLNLYLGGFLYLASAVLNIILLRYLDYSVVLPLTSLTYVWTMCISRMCLGERITGEKMCGVLMICVGAWCIAM